MNSIMDAYVLDQALARPWDETAELFKPFENEQILPADSAVCLAVEIYLNICQLKFVVRERWNAQFMSPTGEVPFVRCDNFLHAGFDGVVEFVAKKGLNASVDSGLDQLQLEGLTCMLHKSFGRAQALLSWQDENIFNQITRHRYTSVYPWPLGSLLVHLERRRVLAKLTESTLHAQSLDTVLDEVDRCCSVVCRLLARGNARYIGGTRPCHVDALLAAHVTTALKLNPADQRLVDVVKCYTPLVQLAHCVASEFS